MSKTSTLELAMSRAKALPDAAQEQLGRQVLEHIASLTHLRSEIMKGIRSLDAGKGRKLGIEKFLKQAHARYAKETKKTAKYFRHPRRVYATF